MRRRRVFATRFPHVLVKVGAIGPAVGTVNGLFGVGGGFMVVPALILVRSSSQHEPQSGPSLTIIALISAVLGTFAIWPSRLESPGLCVAGQRHRYVAGGASGIAAAAGGDGPRTASVTISIALILIVVNASSYGDCKGERG